MNAVHPSVIDAYQKGFRDGVVTTLDELEKAHPLPTLTHWITAIREKVERDRG